MTGKHLGGLALACALFAPVAALAADTVTAIAVHARSGAKVEAVDDGKSVELRVTRPRNIYADIRIEGTGGGPGTRSIRTDVTGMPYVKSYFRDDISYMGRIPYAELSADGVSAAFVIIFGDPHASYKDEQRVVYRLAR